MAEFSNNTNPITLADIEKGFSGCGGDGLQMSSANMNAIFKWLSNINWDGIPFKNLADLAGKDFQIANGAAVVDGDQMYIRRGDRVYKMDLNASNVPYDDENWFLSTDAPTTKDALDQLSAFLSTAFGDDLVVLNNPIFYIRQSTGSANPDITDQSDMTVANAFDSYENLLDFIKRTYIIGNTTIDARGVFNSGDFLFRITPSNMKGVGNVLIRGDESNPDLLEIVAGNDDSNGRPTSGIYSSGNISISAIDLCLRLVPSSSPDSQVIGMAVAADGASVKFGGTIKLKGSFDASDTAISSRVFYATSNSKISFEGADISGDRQIHIIVDFDAGTSIDAFFSTTLGSDLSITSPWITINRDLSLDANVFYTISGASTRISYAGPGALIEGPGSFVTDTAIRTKANSNLSFYSMTTDPLDNMINDWRFSGSSPLIEIDKYSYMDGKYGVDWDSDARVNVS